MYYILLIISSLVRWVAIISFLSIPLFTRQFENPPKLRILYLTDSSPIRGEKKEILDQFAAKIRNTSIEFEQQSLPNNITSLLPLIRVLNRSISWENTGIIILDIEKSQLRSVSLFSSCGIVFDVKTRPMSEEKVFPDTFLIKPSFTRLHFAVRRIFGEIGWTTMAEIECYNHSVEDVRKMQKTMDSIRLSAFTFIFVKCLQNLDDVLNYGEEIGLTGSEYRWVFAGIVQLQGISHALPKNVIAIDLPGAMERDDSTKKDLLFLKDVLGVLENALKENHQKLITGSELRGKKFSTKFKGFAVNHSFAGFTGDVIFDEDGRRSGEHYQIFELISFNGNPQWLPIGSLEKGNVKILFNQWQLDKQPSDETPELRVVTILEAPWVIYSSEQHRTPSGDCEIGRVCRSYPENGTTFEGSAYKDHCCTGLVIEFLEKLESNAKFRGVVHFVKDGMFGSKDPTTHEWTGMIGEVVRGEADMAISVLTITAKRSQVVDFTYPFINAANGILVSTEPAVHTLWEFVFLDTFSVPLWVALFVTVQIVIVTLWLAERLRQRRRLSRDPNKRDNSISYAEIINYTYSLVFQKASEEVGPSSLGGRTVAALFAFCTIIACSSFTANLAAIKVSERAGISISGIRDSKFQNPSSDFTFGTFGGSANLDFFRYSKDAAFQRIYTQINKHLVYNSEQGAENVAARKWTAYIDDIPILNYVISKRKDCTLKIVGAPFFFSGYGIALPKNSTWNGPLSLVITEFLREEVMHDLQSKWLKSACVDSKQPVIEKMGVNDIGGSFLIVAFGCIAGGVLLGVEFVVWKIMLMTKHGTEEDEETQTSNRITQAITPLTKLFTMWDVNQTQKPVLSQTGATLRHFKSFTNVRHVDENAH